MINERTYAECKTCCSGCSSGDSFRVEDWADKHEDETGHKVKIHYGE